MINRKFSGPLGRATKFSHPRATMSVIVVMFIAANKFTAFCAIRLLDFRPTDHRRQQNIGGVRVLVASTTKGVVVTLGGSGVEMRAAASGLLDQQARLRLQRRGGTHREFAAWNPDHPLRRLARRGRLVRNCRPER